MATFSPPIYGVARGMSPDQSPPLTTDHMLNVLPQDSLERRIRLGQRPGMDKWDTNQLGAGGVVVDLGIIETVE